MMLPTRRTQWVAQANNNIQENDICLQQILAVVTPISGEAMQHALTFIDENYKNHPDLPKLTQAVKKILDGKVIDDIDYIDNIAFQLAPIYSDQTQALLESSLGRILNQHRRLTVAALGMLSYVSKTCSYMHDTLVGCKLDVLNHFCKNEFPSYNLIDTILENKSIYELIPICFVSATRDHMVTPYLNANLIYPLLFRRLSIFNFNNKHLVASDSPVLFYQLIDGLLRGNIDETFIQQHCLPGEPGNIVEFQLADLHAEQMAEFKNIETRNSLVNSASSSSYFTSFFALFGSSQPTVHMPDSTNQLLDSTTNNNKLTPS
jgi:hypothetical protein